MPPEQLVELEIVVGRVVVAIPPEPIASFRDQHLFTGAGKGRFRKTWRRALERATGSHQLPPGAVVVGMSDPDVEVAVDPRPRKDGRQRFGGPRTRLAHRYRPQFGMGGQLAVKRAKEGPSLIL